MPELLIRAGRPEDIPRLFALWQEKMTLLRQLNPRVPVNGPSDAWMADIRGRMGRSCSAVIVAESAGQPVGFLAAELRMDDTVFVESMALDLHAYFPGAASRMVEFLQTQYGSQHQVEIRADQQLAVEQAFWRALGAQDRMGKLWLTL